MIFKVDFHRPRCRGPNIALGGHEVVPAQRDERALSSVEKVIHAHQMQVGVSLGEFRDGILKPVSGE